MTIELSLERIANALEKLVTLPTPIETTKVKEEKVLDVEANVVEKGDSIFGETPVTEIKSKKRAKAKPKKAAKPVVKKAAKLVEKLTKEDVVREARILVDNYKENRKGFEKAKEILSRLGAPEMDLLAPEKFAEAINAFRKAVKTFGDSA